MLALLLVASVVVALGGGLISLTVLSVSALKVSPSASAPSITAYTWVLLLIIWPGYYIYWTWVFSRWINGLMMVLLWI